MPLHVVAVDVVTGEELLLSKGPILEAVMPSAAIPAVLPPVDWEDRELMDGGVANNTPISHAIELGAREIYVLPTAKPAPWSSRPAAPWAWRSTRSACSPTAGSSPTSSCTKCRPSWSPSLRLAL